MKLFLWDGHLNREHSYQSWPAEVVVYAESLERAWEVFKENDPLAWEVLSGHDSYYCEIEEATKYPRIEPREITTELVVVNPGIS
jgi:hypothetical protein